MAANGKGFRRGNNKGHGLRQDEMTVSQVAALWGLGHTRTWELIKEGAVPYRQDYNRIYVLADDARAYEHRPKRGRPPKGGEGRGQADGRV